MTFRFKRQSQKSELEWRVDIAAFIPDVFFQVRVASAAHVAGRSVRFLTTPDDLGAVSLVLVDLDAIQDIGPLIESLREQTQAPIVAFGPHVDTERRKVARRAGANRVLAKSKFVTELPKMMQENSSGGAREIESLRAQLAAYGRRLEDLGRRLQDGAALDHLYFAPAPHMESDPSAIILDGTAYDEFLAVDVLSERLDRLRALQGTGGRTSQSIEE